MTTTTETAVGAPPEAPAKHRKQLSEGARAERRFGWLLCAPAVIVMIAVTAYPIVYAVYLSLQRYNLAFPNLRKFVGFSNYGAVLSSPYWWRALVNTLVITVISVAIELVLGMLLALLMHRTIFGRGTVRTFALIPYGIVTVAAAYSWQFAWTPSTGASMSTARRSLRATGSPWMERPAACSAATCRRSRAMSCGCSPERCGDPTLACIFPSRGFSPGRMKLGRFACAPTRTRRRMPERPEALARKGSDSVAPSTCSSRAIGSRACGR